MLPDFTTLTPRSTGTTDSLVLGGIPAREENFGVVYDGHLRVPRDGVYRFTLASDDGSRLIIDRNTVVNNDGVHGTTEQHGDIALKAGDHPFTLLFFQGVGGKDLGVRFEGPGIAQRPLSPDQLFHE